MQYAAAREHVVTVDVAARQDATPTTGIEGVAAVEDASVVEADEIAGLDPRRPLLPQFDLLTDEQIRTAFRSMDPLDTGRHAAEAS